VHLIFTLYWHGLALLASAAVAVWMASLKRHDVSIVDSLWPLLFLIAALYFGYAMAWHGPRPIVTAGLVGLSSLRLCVYITVRNWGHGEDRRYQVIRARNQPHFELKSLYLVFLLQAFMASIVALPLLGAALDARALGVLGLLGVLLWLVGFVFEALGDWQLQRFKADPGNHGKVMDRGLWRYTRHPNYFGEFAMWWGLFAIAAEAGAWWSIGGPVLMSVLLLRVSGVTLLEKDIGERRPQYRDYVRRTNAFFPGMPRS
jgi:steroid 5-alpha reductase family enzyme